MTPNRSCPLCALDAPVAFPERIDDSKITQFTYASRKRPELMHYEYCECQSCELLFASRRPTTEDLLTSYAAAAFDAGRESRFAAKTYVKALNLYLTSGTSVLDVGCGDGAFLNECRVRGLRRLQGIEPSLSAANAADNNMRANIFLGGHEDFQTHEKFDVITLFQTVEHILDPVGFFSSIRRFARPGGYLAVACHDYQSTVNRALGERSPIFDIEHLQIFSKSSISRALEAGGLKVNSVKSYTNTYPIAYWLRLAPVPASIKDSDALMRSGMSQVPLTLPLGNIMAVGQFR